MWVTVKVLWTSYFLSRACSASSINLRRTPSTDEALARGSITCPGPRPDFNIPHHSGWNLAQVSAQLLCAKPIYGGDKAGMYGYCLQADQYDPRWPVAAVAFEESAPVSSLAFSFELSAQIALFCRENCYCNKWKGETPSRITEIPAKPKGYPFRHANYPQSQLKDNILQLHISAAAPLEQSDGPHIKWLWETDIITPAHDSTGTYTNILLGDQLREINTLYQGRTVHMSLHPQNQIICSNQPLPRNLDIPFPYTKRELRRMSTLEICGAALTGGHGGVNAGAICYQSSDGSHIGFVDGLIPRPEWKQQPFKYSVQAFCRRACSCKFEPTVMDSDMSEGEMEAEPPQRSNTRLRYAVVMNPGGTAELGYTSDSGESSTEHSCPMETDMDGTTCTNTAANIAANPSASSGPTCGSTCDGPARTSCSQASGVTTSAATQEDCQCVYLSDSVTRVLGMDPVSMSGGAMCLLASYVRARIAGIRSGDSKVGVSSFLGGRSLIDDGLNCMCNSTYASPGCCGSDTGVVWEERGMRLSI